MAIVHSQEEAQIVVTQGYQTILGRAPDTAGFVGWAAELGEGMPLEEGFGAIAGSDEYEGDQLGVDLPVLDSPAAGVDGSTGASDNGGQNNTGSQGDNTGNGAGTNGGNTGGASGGNAGNGGQQGGGQLNNT